MRICIKGCHVPAFVIGVPWPLWAIPVWIIRNVAVTVLFMSLLPGFGIVFFIGGVAGLYAFDDMLHGVLGNCIWKPSRKPWILYRYTGYCPPDDDEL